MAKNHLRLDPSRTTMLRRQFVTDMNKRFREIKRLIKQFLVTDDELGLKPRTLGIPGVTLAGLESLVQKYAFLTNPQKTKAFRDWLQVQIDAKVLSVDGLGRPWTNTYIDSAYRKGFVRSYADANPPAVSGTPDFFQGGQQQFIKDAFAQPEALSKLEMLFTRAFEDLKDVTTSMSAKMNRILTDGIAHGDGPETISREMFNEIDKLTRTRARVIARTEVINAHAEGQLDSFERLGVDELNLQAEWVTAGDDRVCVFCQEQEGRIYSVKEARGLIPLHPNCRCAWVPVTRKKKAKAVKQPTKKAKKTVKKKVVKKEQAKPKSDALQFVGETSKSFQAAVQKQWDEIPEKVKLALKKKEVTVKAGETTVEINPALKGIHPRGWDGHTWEHAEGFQDWGNRVVGVAQKSRNIQDGRWYNVAPLRRKGVMNHEIGHAFDYASGKSSNTSAFIKAYADDLARINNLTSKTVASDLEYLLQAGSAGREETFAELVAIKLGKSSMSTHVSNVIKKNFKDSLGFIEGMF